MTSNVVMRVYKLIPWATNHAHGAPKQQNPYLHLKALALPTVVQIVNSNGHVCLWWENRRACGPSRSWQSAHA